MFNNYYANLYLNEVEFLNQKLLLDISMIPFASKELLNNISQNIKEYQDREIWKYNKTTEVFRNELYDNTAKFKDTTPDDIQIENASTRKNSNECLPTKSYMNRENKDDSISDIENENNQFISFNSDKNSNESLLSKKRYNQNFSEKPKKRKYIRSSFPHINLDYLKMKIKSYLLLYVYESISFKFIQENPDWKILQLPSKYNSDTNKLRMRKQLSQSIYDLFTKRSTGYTEKELFMHNKRVFDKNKNTELQMLLNKTLKDWFLEFKESNSLSLIKNILKEKKNIEYCEAFAYYTENFLDLFQ